MAQKKVGDLIKEARTKKGFSQDKLASMVEGLTASEVSKAERGEKDLTQDELKGIAKATGVTQKSLLEAAGYVSSTAKKPAAATAAAKKPAAATTAKKPATTAKKPAASAAKTSTAAKKTTTTKTEEIKLTAAEKRFLTLYREASAALRKDAEAVLKGEKQVQEEAAGNPLMEGLLGGALDILSGLGKK